jgi:hypothetical protein
MRGFLAPSLTRKPSDVQRAFAVLSRGRRTKLAKGAKTTLVKADQWARGDEVAAEVANALAQGLAALQAKGAKKQQKAADRASGAALPGGKKG